MTDRKQKELTEKAKAILKLTKELSESAEKEDYGVNFTGDTISFEDWLSSDCYGEGNDAGFTVGEDGVWYSSSC